MTRSLPPLQPSLPWEGVINEILRVEHPIRQLNGEIIGNLDVSASPQRINLENARLIHSQLQDFAIIALVIILVVAFTVTSLVRPIISITQVMTKLAERGLDTPIAEADRKDGIGDMVRALGVFKANAEYVQKSLDKERELSGLQRQVFSNLLSNAIKYSPKGIRISVIGKMSDDNELMVSVRDEGGRHPTRRTEEAFRSFLSGKHIDRHRRKRYWTSSRHAFR